MVLSLEASQIQLTAYLIHLCHSFIVQRHVVHACSAGGTVDTSSPELHSAESDLGDSPCDDSLCPGADPGCASGMPYTAIMLLAS